MVDKDMAVINIKEYDDDTCGTIVINPENQDIFCSYITISNKQSKL